MIQFRAVAYILLVVAVGIIAEVWQSQRAKQVTVSTSGVQKSPFTLAGPNVVSKLVRRVIAGLVKDDMVRTSSSFLSQGQLCYSFTLSQPTQQDYLVVRRGETMTTYDFGGHENDSPLDPTFSPDGRRIAFFVGDPDSQYSDRELYVLDVETGAIHESGQGGRIFNAVAWSRDGRFLAFGKHGDIDGNPIFADEFADHPSLWIYDLQKGHEWQVVQDDAINRGFEWGENDELFFSAREGIYKVKLTGPKTLVLRDARSPIISPSGRKIAFLRPGNSFSRSKYPALCVAKSDGTQKRILKREAEFNPVNTPVFAWSRDEKRVFRVQRDATPKRGEVVTYDVQTGKSQHVGQFQSAAFQGNAPWFFHLREENSVGLVCDVNSFTGASTDAYTTSQTLQSIDTRGQTYIWASRHGGSTLDWNNHL